MDNGQNSRTHGLMAVLLAFLLAFSFVGCGSGGAVSSDSAQGEGETVVEADPAADEAESGDEAVVPEAEGVAEAGDEAVVTEAETDDEAAATEAEVVDEAAATAAEAEASVEEQQTRSAPVAAATTDEAEAETVVALDEQGSYTSKDEVAWYLYTYGHLPPNYLTKKEAEAAGWKTQGLSLGEACPGMSIGGDRFGNREGLLPVADGRTYYECDIDYDGKGGRNAKRLIYSNDGLIFYTEDHYQTFEQLY